MGRLRPPLVAAVAGVAALLATGCSQTSSGVPKSTAEPSLAGLATASPTPTPTQTNAALPPAGLPVFYISHPGDRGLTAVDDQGHSAGVVVLPSDMGVEPSPDGSAYITLDNRVLDQAGSLLATLPDKAVSWWADDSRHLCVLGLKTAREPRHLRRWSC